MRRKMTTVLFLLISAVFFLGILFKPDQAVSYTERRKLTAFPQLTWKGVLSGTFEKKLDRWLGDQVPFRAGLVRSALTIRIQLLRLQDNEGIYKAQGRLSKFVYPLNETACRRSGERIAYIARTIFPTGHAYYTIVPQKGTYLSAASGRPELDLNRLTELVGEKAGEAAAYLPIDGLLGPEDYYQTDLHWRQERLFPVAECLCRGMDRSLPRQSYTAHAYSPFMGAYYARWPGTKADTLVYLTSGETQKALVDMPGAPYGDRVYDLPALSGMDPYDIFLSGPVPVVCMVNPVAASQAKGKTLILVRDSFGSSLAPLLLPAYEKIILLDFRYLDPTLANVYGEADADTDVLFLYCIETVNTGGGLR